MKVEGGGSNSRFADVLYREGYILEMQTVADMREVGVKNRGKSADGP